MRIAIACDHKGYPLKNEVIAYLKNKSMEVMDFGTYSEESVDYPDYAVPACLAVRNHQVDFGILICYTGIGMSIVANKVKGIRAALIDKADFARLTREHNDANVLCLGSKDMPFEAAQDIIDTFLGANFAGGRHVNRINKVMAVEEHE